MSAFDHSITEVVTSTGRKVACSYLSNPNYNPTSNVCACLHWLFLLYCPARRAPLLTSAPSVVQMGITPTKALLVDSE